MFVSGCAGDTRRYRVFHQAEALWLAGWHVRVRLLERGGLQAIDLRAEDVLICHRAEWSPIIARLFDRARDAGCALLYDCDDLIFEPEAVATLPDLAPLPGQPRRPAGEVAAGCRRALQACDGVLVPTEYLAARVRSLGKPAAVVPNALSLEQLRLARQAARLVSAEGGRDESVLIGYASGTPTHDRDFAVAQGALQRLLREDRRLRLRLFGYLQLDDSWRSLAERLEQVDFMPWRDLVMALGQLDVNLAPLQVGDPFCESKSELKYVEAGVLGVPTVASATLAYRQAIADGSTGFVAASPADWYARLQALVADAELRRTMGIKARADVLARYLTDQRAVDLAAAIGSLTGRQLAGAEMPARPLSVVSEQAARWLLRRPARRDRSAEEEPAVAGEASPQNGPPTAGSGRQEQLVWVLLPAADEPGRELLRQAMWQAQERVPGARLVTLESFPGSGSGQPNEGRGWPDLTTAEEPEAPAAIVCAPDLDWLSIAVAQALAPTVMTIPPAGLGGLIVPGVTAAVAVPLADALAAQLLTVIADAAYRDRLASGGRLAGECWARLFAAGWPAGGLAQAGSVESASLWCLDWLQPLCGPGPLALGGRSVAQSFVSRLDGLARFDVRWATVPADQTGEVRLEIRHGHLGGPVVRQARLDFAELIPDEWASFTFPAIDHSAGRRFVACLTCTPINADEAPALWLADVDVFARGRTYVDGHVVRATLSFRTFCHLPVGLPAGPPFAVAADPAVMQGAARLAAVIEQRRQIEVQLSAVETDRLHAIVDFLRHRLARLK